MFNCFATSNNVQIKTSFERHSCTIVITPIQAYELVLGGTCTVIDRVRIHTFETVFYDQLMIDGDGLFVVPSIGVVLNGYQTDQVYDACVDLTKRIVDSF